MFVYAGLVVESQNRRPVAEEAHTKLATRTADEKPVAEYKTIPFRGYKNILRV